MSETNGAKTVAFGDEKTADSGPRIAVVDPERWDAESDWRFPLQPIQQALEAGAAQPVDIRFRESSLTAKDPQKLREFSVNVQPKESIGAVAGRLRESMAPVLQTNLVERLLRWARIREADSFGADLSGTLGVFADDPEREFLQTIGGPFSKSLQLGYFLQAQAECFWELHHNPLARAVVQTKNDFVCGRGVKFRAKDPKFQQVFDEWAERDGFQRRLRQSDHDLTFQGELMWRCFGIGEGRVTVRLVDPSTIWEVIANPEDVEEVYGYWQLYQGAINIHSMMVGGKMVPTQAYKISVIPANEIVRLISNVAYGEKRGRSDFFPALAWFRRARRFMSAKSISAEFENAFAWDMKLLGTGADVQAAKDDPDMMKSPRPGSTWIHNAAVEITPMSAKAGARGSSGADIMLDLVRWIGATCGIPIEYLGWGDASTKAQAITSTQPWAKRVAQSQLVLETELLRPFVKKMHAVAQAAGLVDRKSTPEGEFTWPEPAPEDIDARLSRLAFLKDTGVIARKRYMAMAAGEINLTEYDADAEDKLIQQDREQQAEAGMASLYDQARARANGLAGNRTMGPEDRAAQQTDAAKLKGEPESPTADDGDE